MLSETNPYLWSTLASLFLGLALGQCLRWLIPGKGNARAGIRRGPPRLARATSFLALSILALAGFLVFSYKVEGLASGALADGMIAWSLAITFLALLVGSRPLIFGLPVACLGIAILVVLGSCLQGWLPLRIAEGGSHEIGQLLPYEVGPASFRGQFEMHEHDSVPIVQELSLASDSIGICVESLDLRGPLAFLADLVLPSRLTPLAAPTENALRLYRIAGLVAPGGAALHFPSPARLRFLDAVLPLPENLGFQPGGVSETRSALFGLAQRRRASSPTSVLAALQPLRFFMTSDSYFPSVHRFAQ